MLRLLNLYLFISWRSAHIRSTANSREVFPRFACFNLVSEIVVFLWVLKALEGLENTGRLVGKSPPIRVPLRLHDAKQLYIEIDLFT